MRRRPKALLSIVWPALMVAGCTSVHAGTPSASTSATATPMVVTVQPSPASDPTPAAPTSPAAHPCGPAAITAIKGSPPAPICLTADTDLKVTTDASPLQPWSPLTSSDPTILDCRTTAHPNGSITATCHAQQPGTVTLTATTAPFAGDPHGPPQYRWQITVTVRTG